MTWMTAWESSGKQIKYSIECILPCPKVPLRNHIYYIQIVIWICTKLHTLINISPLNNISQCWRWWKEIPLSTPRSGSTPKCKFHGNPSSSFCRILLTNRQTHKHTHTNYYNDLKVDGSSHYHSSVMKLHWFTYLWKSIVWVLLWLSKYQKNKQLCLSVYMVCT